MASGGFDEIKVVCMGWRLGLSLENCDGRPSRGAVPLEILERLDARVGWWPWGSLELADVALH